jgi:hypothetical protein
MRNLFLLLPLTIIGITTITSCKKIGCTDPIVSFFIFGYDKKDDLSNLRCAYIYDVYCKSIMKGSQVIPLNQMEYAYAIQKYPSLLEPDGLSVPSDKRHTRFIVENCAQRVKNSSDPGVNE